MRGVILCEFSGVLSEAFRRHGIECFSCDITPTEGDSKWHIQKDALDVAYNMPWDFAIMHPPCTHTATSGNKLREAKYLDGREQDALDFILKLSRAPIRHKCIEQPISITSRVLGQATQRVKAHYFGHNVLKTFDLWLWQLPALQKTKLVHNAFPTIHLESSGPNQARNRSRTFTGMAEAMASQWSKYILDPPEYRPIKGFGQRSSPQA